MENVLTLLGALRAHAIPDLQESRVLTMWMIAQSMLVRTMALVSMAPWTTRAYAHTVLLVSSARQLQVI